MVKIFCSSLSSTMCNARCIIIKQFGPGGDWRKLKFNPAFPTSSLLGWTCLVYPSHSYSFFFYCCDSTPSANSAMFVISKCCLLYFTTDYCYCYCYSCCCCWGCLELVCLPDAKFVTATVFGGASAASSTLSLHASLYSRLACLALLSFGNASFAHFMYVGATWHNNNMLLHEWMLQQDHKLRLDTAATRHPQATNKWAAQF